MSKKIEVGSKVQYTPGGISTGPSIMTIESLRDENPVIANCSWKENGQARSNDFDIGDLTLVVPGKLLIVPTSGL